MESRLKGQGLVLDTGTANAHVGIWLREVANARLHAETKERPADRFEQERPRLLRHGPRWIGLPPPPCPPPCTSLTSPCPPA